MQRTINYIYDHYDTNKKYIFNGKIIGNIQQLIHSGFNIGYIIYMIDGSIWYGNKDSIAIECSSTDVLVPYYVNINRSIYRN